MLSIPHGPVSSDVKFNPSLNYITNIFKYIDIELEWEGFKQEDLIVTKPQLRQAPTTGMVYCYSFIFNLFVNLNG